MGGGTTYSEAIDFCSSQEGDASTLCPYEVYCPTGPHHIPLGGYRGIDSDGNAESSSRAPISNYNEGWVQVGNKNSCVQYSLVEPGDDDEWQQWGMVMKRRIIRLMNCYRLRKIIRSSSNTMAQAMRLGGHPFQQGTSPHHNPFYRQPLLTTQNLQSQYLQQFERLLPHIAKQNAPQINAWRLGEELHNEGGACYTIYYLIGTRRKDTLLGSGGGGIISVS